jgi:hypothetical protein
MKRLFISLTLAIFGFVALPVAASAASYSYADLSTTIPHKSASKFDGLWNDSRNWLATNGYMLYEIDGGSFALTNRTSAMHRVGMYGMYNAAGMDGTWLVFGTGDGTKAKSTSGYYYDAEDSFFAVMQNGAFTRVDANAVNRQKYQRVGLFRAGRGLFVLTESSDRVTRLYELIGNQLIARSVPSWVKADEFGYGVNEGLDMLFSRNKDFETWVRFNGIEWSTVRISETKDWRQIRRFVKARGDAYWGRDSYFEMTHELAHIYEMVDPRDALLRASRRPDGTALLTGFAENGVRLVLVSPSASVGIGTVHLVVEPLSPTRYRLTATASASVGYIRILKNGIGIAKCNGTRRCETEVDVTNSADRFEAWAQPLNSRAYSLTSRAVVLRDTNRVLETGVWYPHANQERVTRGEYWTWAQPGSFRHEYAERMSWHTSMFLPEFVQQVFGRWVENKYETSFEADPDSVDRIKKTIDTLTVDVYVEGEHVKRCKLPESERNELLTTIQNQIDKKTNVSLSIDVKDCISSVAREDIRNLRTWSADQYNYYLNSEISVRVYAKISWDRGDKKVVTISPTDLVTFKKR